jgi:hypothetical protein
MYYKILSVLKWGPVVAFFQHSDTLGTIRAENFLTIESLSVAVPQFVSITIKFITDKVVLVYLPRFFFGFTHLNYDESHILYTV